MAVAITTKDATQIEPNSKKQLLTTNYKNVYNYADELAPDTMNEVVQMFSNQTLTGFLETFANEKSFSADTTFWAEERKFRVNEKGVTRADNVFTKAGHNIRKDDKVWISDVSGKKVDQGIVTAVTDGGFTVSQSNAAAWTVGTAALIVKPIGSEFKKGTNGKEDTIVNRPHIYSTSPIIEKDMYKINNTDKGNIAWLKAPDGGFYWYSSEEQKAMFNWFDTLELSMIAGRTAASGSAAATAGYKGTMGLFEAIEERGSVAGGGISSLADVNDVIKHLDKTNGAGSNTLLCTTAMSSSIETMLASLNRNFDNGSYYGQFDNGKKFLDLGFDGFKLQSYNFNKQTWKMLKDDTAFAPGNTAAEEQINAIMIPEGVSQVHNGESSAISGMTFENIPYLTLMYKEGRKLNTSFDGDFVNNGTGDYFAVHWKTERCLRPVGMLKWLMFKGV